MTLNQFNRLNEIEQAKAVWNGVHIGERFNEVNMILLYQIDGFYVEIYYNPLQNRVVGLRSFSSTEQLHPYLEQINIDELIIRKEV